MKVFDSHAEALHAPSFFLMRGALRANYEIPARAAALRQGLRDSLGALTPTLAPPATRESLRTIHTADYLDFLEDAARDWIALPEAGPEVVANIHPSPEMLAQSSRAPSHIIARAGAHTADTACPIGPHTWDAALGAAGCALAAAECVVDGGSAYALCRPPGHHAYAARAGGHCYLNNSALAAQRLRALGAARVAILDIDSHHGNGTQGIFWERGDVLSVSLHADPGRYYPWYVGFSEERGGGDGAGANLNLPQPFGTADASWLAALAQAIEAIRLFRPEALVVPLGFDASEHEPLAALRVTEDGFARAGEAIAALRLPTAICQEGGYNVDLLPRLLSRFLSGYGA